MSILVGPVLDATGVRTRGSLHGLPEVPCELCTEPLYNGAPIEIVCEREHVLHVECMRQWKYTCAQHQRAPTCPMCRGAALSSSSDANAPVRRGDSEYERQTIAHDPVAVYERQIINYQATLEDENKLRARSLEMLTGPDVEFARREQELNILVARKRMERARAEGAARYPFSPRDAARIADIMSEINEMNLQQLTEELARTDLREDYRNSIIPHYNIAISNRRMMTEQPPGEGPTFAENIVTYSRLGMVFPVLLPQFLNMPPPPPPPALRR